MNIMKKPGRDLPYGALPGTLRSDGKIFMVLTYSWQEDVAKIFIVPGARAL